MPPVIKKGPNKGKRDHKREGRVERRNHPERKKERAARNRARRKLGLKKGDPRQADHKKPLSEGGSNARSNLRAVSAKSNSQKEVARKKRKARGK